MAPTARASRAPSTPGPRTERLIIGRMVDADWTLDDAAWVEVAEVYSRPFEAAVRSKTDEAAIWRAGFEEIGNLFIAETRRESAAPARADAERYLDDLEKKAAELAEAIEGKGVDPLAISMARADLDARLALRDWPAASDGTAPPVMPLRDLAAHASDAAQAAAIARRAMEDEPTTTQGDAWGRFIKRLVAFCEKHSLPVGVSCDSAFVAFVGAFQRKLPENVRPPDRTPSALERAIGRALKA